MTSVVLPLFVGPTNIGARTVFEGPVKRMARRATASSRFAKEPASFFIRFHFTSGLPSLKLCEAWTSKNSPWKRLRNASVAIVGTLPFGEFAYSTGR